MIPLDLSLAEVPGLPAHAARLLGKEGVKTVADVVWHLPFRHEDRRQMQALAFQAGPLPVCHHVLVTKTGNKFFGGRSGVFEAVVRHATGLLGQQLTLKWWNMPFMSRVLAEGQELIVYGVIKDTKGRLGMAHPEYEIVKGGADDDAEQIHTGRITPIYRLRGSMTQKALRVAAWHVFQVLSSSFTDDLLPTPSAEGEFAAVTRSLALREAHFPSSMEKLEQARRYLALEEFYGYQLRVARRKRRVIESGGRKQIGTGDLLRDFFNELPFQLTTAQSRCLDEIHRDMASGAPMNRLLHGDVGSGKTVVAFAAMLRAVESGRQAVLMAPTQILAEQHARNARKWLEPLGLRVALRTGSKREDGDGAELLGRSARVPRAVSRVSRETHPASSQETRYSRRRLPHFERPWAKYFITFSTAARRKLLESMRQIVLDAIRHFHGNRYHLYAACVMPDHVHMLIEPAICEREPGTDAPVFHKLTDILHSLKSFTAHEIVKAGWPDQHVWEKESFDRLIRSEADLLEKFEYTVGNPEEAGLAGPEEDYAWVWPSGDGAPRDAEHGTRDACAPVRNANAPEIVIGTHALLHDAELMHNTGIVVIDEQHKFGVAQRAKLIRKGDTPDVLVMTATPIPRTLTLTIYGDLEVSTIDQKPRDGVKIITKVRPKSKLKEAAKFLREQIEEGRQGYIVYPLIDESEKLEAGAATKGHEEWSKLLAPCEVGLLHGRLSAEEKEDVMKRFRAGKLDALVSTTVIEVGIDVPNATVMFIHDAGRFGLAQLHQLRGRIGRGAHTSYCVLFVDDKDEESRQRLAIMEETSDGFQIAEEDLRRRGPGDVLGHAQSGQAPLRFGELLADTRLVRLARQLAEKTLDEDPQLQRPALAAFREEPTGADKAQAMMQ
ncbi:MAG: DEAD/DEAH box helicase [Verrucomicrobiaceae bacterium]|nr:DEAD/DEAH box helicase [Verrucomicrobiaceae bacterium]